MEINKTNMKPKLIFAKKALPLILDVFYLSIKNGLMVNENDEPILCYACSKPVKAKEVAGIANIEGNQAWFHDNMDCLMDLTDKVKEKYEK